MEAIRPYEEIIADRIRGASQELSYRWLQRLKDVLTVDRDEIFPTDDLLDHIPQLIEEIAGYVAAPHVEALPANTAVIGKARELGLLRHAQQASVHQLLREYHLLAGILQTFLEEETDRLNPPPAPRDVLVLCGRIAEALRLLQQTTIDTFIAEYTDRIAAQQARLEGFNRLVSHELRQPLGTLQFATRLLHDAIASDDPERARRVLSTADASVARLVTLTDQLERMARLKRTSDDPGRQDVEVSMLAREVARQLREMAEHRGVEIRVAEDLPSMCTDVSRLELILMNLVSNGIKYSDPAKSDRFVEVFLSGASADGRTICIRDNGIGIAPDHLPHIFDSFFRGSPERDDELAIQGSGLGLAIVKECVDAVGGQIAVASVQGEGTAFDLWLPERSPSASS